MPGSIEAAGAHELDDLGCLTLNALHWLTGAGAEVNHCAFVRHLVRAPHRAVVLPALEVLDRDGRCPPVLAGLGHGQLAAPEAAAPFA